MALTNLDLKFKACVENGCQVIQITDTTGVYHVTDNPGGWENAATVLSSSITSVLITITLPDGTVMTPIEALEQKPNPVVTAEFEYTPIALPAKKDGEYKITYTVVQGALTKIVSTTIFSTCNVRCCVDSLWAKYGASAIDKEDCGCTGSKSATIQERALLGEALLSSIHSSGICNNPTTRNLLLEKLERLCKLENCNCK